MLSDIFIKSSEHEARDEKTTFDSNSGSDFMPYGKLPGNGIKYEI